jgi:hypothetical protein
MGWAGGGIVSIVTTYAENIAEAIADGFREITGVVTSSSGPLSEPIDNHLLPCAEVTIGGTATATLTETAITTHNRIFRARLYIAAIDQGTDAPVPSDDIALGAYNYGLAVPFFDRVHVYFADHPQFQTDAVTPSVAVSGVLWHKLTDGGVVPRPGPGGARYWVIDFQFVVTYKITLPCTL